VHVFVHTSDQCRGLHLDLADARAIVCPCSDAKLTLLAAGWYVMAPVANAYASEACGTDPKAAATAAARGWVLAIPVSWQFHPAPLDKVTF